LSSGRNGEPKTVYSPARLASRLKAMGRAVSRDYSGKTLDAVIILEDAFVFSADLLRCVTRPVVFHFVRLETRDVELGGFSRREVFFSRQPELQGRDVLILAAVLDTGVTMDFLYKRVLENQPRSLRIAVLVDKPDERRVDLQPDYFGFLGASNRLVGYGLAGRDELYRNLPFLGELGGRGSKEGKRGPAKRNLGAKRPR
jgi:hypoxanthine phosphoribosyltransferase